MRRIAVTLASAGAVTALAITCAVPALAAPRAASPRAAATSSYYLSLGDSLAQGVEPNAKGQDVETKQGYPDQLFGALRLSNPALRLVKLGCPGETTTSMISGGICSYPRGSQLKQAVAFLRLHRSHMELVTIDIGANDLNPCLVLTNEQKLIACLSKVIPVAVKHLVTIMGALRAADPAAHIIAMNYYDPELAGWLLGTSAARSLAKASVTLAKAFDGDLSAVYTKFGASVADVYTAFQTSDLTNKVTLPEFGTVPRDVAMICAYTWECAAPPVGPNEHATQLGYGVIANAFLTTDYGG